MLNTVFMYSKSKMYPCICNVFTRHPQASCKPHETPASRTLSHTSHAHVRPRTEKLPAPPESRRTPRPRQRAKRGPARRRGRSRLAHAQTMRSSSSVSSESRPSTFSAVASATWRTATSSGPCIQKIHVFSLYSRHGHDTVHYTCIQSALPVYSACRVVTTRSAPLLTS